MQNYLHRCLYVAAPSLTCNIALIFSHPKSPWNTMPLMFIYKHKASTFYIIRSSYGSTVFEYSSSGSVVLFIFLVCAKQCCWQCNESCSYLFSFVPSFHLLLMQHCNFWKQREPSCLNCKLFQDKAYFSLTFDPPSTCSTM